MTAPETSQITRTARTLHGDILALVRDLVHDDGGDGGDMEGVRYPFQVWWELQVALYALLRRRLLREPDGRELAQELFDTMSRDWDESLRRRGSGDTKTIRLMRRLGRGFYGRLAAYGDSDGAGNGDNNSDNDGDGLRESLFKNLVAAGLSESRAREMTDTLQTASLTLGNVSRDDLLNGCLAAVGQTGGQTEGQKHGQADGQTKAASP
ncbi:MAG: hypothetical protein MPK06_07400 [Alphaproteobacteria bacterium]|nr:hypothetical protein [Alphaproteobacteria bacterium]MDA8004432.1 hypothetical protein [Alphaproteobacteria bacterium]MDA8006339.1 hypothetical protein [Alphaproteobacteria bacterium]MDA8013702.1 hypothetical protein [Alphaproteobacteria bacterium]